MTAVSKTSFVPTEPAPAPAPANQGIDIQQALSILSARSEPSENDDLNRNAVGCGCDNGQISESLLNMGQTIDLMSTQATTTDESVEDPQVRAQRLQDEREERRTQIQEALQSMSTQELLKAVLKAQYVLNKMELP